MTAATLPTQIANEFHAALEGMKTELSAPLAYKVVHSRPVTMRAEPSVRASETARLQPGEVVKGFPAGSWLCVLERDGPLPAGGAWVLIDGTPLGVSILLAPEWSVINLEGIPGGFNVQWPGIVNSGIVYYVQWMPKGAIEGLDGGTVIAMQHEDQFCTATISGIPSGIFVDVRVVACLSCGLLVGPWRTEEVTSEQDMPAAPNVQRRSVSADVPNEQSRKYAALVDQLVKHNGNKLNNVKGARVEEMTAMYANIPREEDKAKEMLLSILFGGAWGEKGKAAAEGNTGDMFAEATGVYEEGLAGECNRVLAEVIGTLVRKHG